MKRLQLVYLTTEGGAVRVLVKKDLETQTITPTISFEDEIGEEYFIDALRDAVAEEFGTGTDLALMAECEKIIPLRKYLSDDIDVRAFLAVFESKDSIGFDATEMDLVWMDEDEISKAGASNLICPEDLTTFLRALQ